MPIIEIYYCSFCHKHQRRVKVIIAGPDRINICDECVLLCHEIVTNHLKEEEGNEQSETNL